MASLNAAPLFSSLLQNTNNSQRAKESSIVTSSANNLKQAKESVAFSSMNHNSNVLSDSELQNLKDSFDLLDEQKKGYITVGYLRSTLSELSTTDPSFAKLHSLLQSLNGLDDAQTLNCSQFVNLLTTPSTLDVRDEVEKVFDLFSENKRYIEADDLCRVAQELGESMDEKQVREMIDRVSTNGKVSVEQFRDIMNKQLFS